MPNLNPTLWRTCKMLAGQTRVRLLRQLHEQPGASVTEHARRAGIGESAASQELRRIQSRGLLKAERQKSRLIYRIAPDPQVAIAAPLCKGICATLAATPPLLDTDVCLSAMGLAHERRIRILRALLAGPLSFTEVQTELRLPGHPCHAHVQTLIRCGYVTRKRGRLHLAPPPHPLGKTLVRLVRRGILR